MLTTGDSFEIQRQKLKVKEWKRYSLQVVTKRAGLALQISNQDIKSKKIYKREKKRHYILIKGSAQQKDTIINTKWHTTNLYEAKTRRIEGENIMIYNNSCRLQCLTNDNG